MRRPAPARRRTVRCVTVPPVPGASIVAGSWSSPHPPTGRTSTGPSARRAHVRFARPQAPSRRASYAGRPQPRGPARSGAHEQGAAHVRPPPTRAPRRHRRDPAERRRRAGGRSGHPHAIRTTQGAASDRRTEPARARRARGRRARARAPGRRDRARRPRGRHRGGHAGPTTVPFGAGRGAGAATRHRTCRAMRAGRAPPRPRRHGDRHLWRRAAAGRGHAGRADPEARGGRGRGHRAHQRADRPVRVRAGAARRGRQRPRHRRAGRRDPGTAGGARGQRGHLRLRRRSSCATR